MVLSAISLDASNLTLHPSDTATFNLAVVGSQLVLTPIGAGTLESGILLPGMVLATSSLATENTPLTATTASRYQVPVSSPAGVNDFLLALFVALVNLKPDRQYFQVPECCLSGLFCVWIILILVGDSPAETYQKQLFQR